MIRFVGGASNPASPRVLEDVVVAAQRVGRARFSMLSAVGDEDAAPGRYSGVVDLRSGEYSSATVCFVDGIHYGREHQGEPWTSAPWDAGHLPISPLWLVLILGGAERAQSAEPTRSGEICATAVCDLDMARRYCGVELAALGGDPAREVSVTVAADRETQLVRQIAAQFRTGRLSATTRTSGPTRSSCRRVRAHRSTPTCRAPGDGLPAISRPGFRSDSEAGAGGPRRRTRRTNPTRRPKDRACSTSFSSAFRPTRYCRIAESRNNANWIAPATGSRTMADMGGRRAAAVIVCVGFAALVVNYAGGIEARCSENGWSGCGWTWQVSGWIVLACLAALLVSGLAAVIRWLWRRSDRTARD
jgi:hypothetical protein